MPEEDPKAFRFRIRQNEHPDDIEKQALRDSINSVESRLEQMSLNIALSSMASTELAKRVNFSIRPVSGEEAEIDTLIGKGIKDMLSSPLNPESDMSEKARKMKRLEKQ